MSDSIRGATEKLEDVVNELGEVLGPSGEGYQIDDIPFKDWADVIRYKSSMTTEQQQKVSDALLSGATIPSWSTSQTSKVLTDYLEQQSLEPTVLAIRGSGSETLPLARLSKCWSRANESSSTRALPLKSLETLIIDNVESADTDALVGHTASGEYGGYESSPASEITDFPLKKIVMRNVDYCNMDHFSNAMTNLEEVDFSGVKSTPDTIIVGANLKRLDLSGLNKTYDLGGNESNDIEVSAGAGSGAGGSIEEVNISKDITGEIRITQTVTSQRASTLRKVKIPHRNKVTITNLKYGARIECNSEAFEAVSSSLLSATTEQNTCQFAPAQEHWYTFDRGEPVYSPWVWLEYWVPSSFNLIGIVVSGVDPDEGSFSLQVGGTFHTKEVVVDNHIVIFTACKSESFQPGVGLCNLLKIGIDRKNVVDGKLMATINVNIPDLYQESRTVQISITDFVD